MKESVLLSMVLLLTNCSSDSAKLDGNPQAMGTIDSITVDEQRGQVQEPAEYVAFRELGNNQFKYYTSSATDVEALISEMKSEGITDSSLLSHERWTAGNCRNMQVRECSSGTCDSGSCELVKEGSFNICRCK